MESKLGDRPNVPLRFAGLTWSKNCCPMRRTPLEVGTDWPDGD
jgi:hypothetical protein